MKKKLTALATKRLTLKAWRWLRDHPGQGKEALPVELHNKLYDMLCRCPLCEYFQDDLGMFQCALCPLDSCLSFDSPYADWHRALCSDRTDQAEIAAAEIVRLVEAWDIKGLDK